MKYLLILFLFLTQSAIAGDYIIGFRGMNEQFDRQAFIEFAQKRNLTPFVFSHNQVTSAMNLIKSKNQNYQLYGYSLGAVSVREVLVRLKRENVKMPIFVTTVGAYKTTNVDFTNFGVGFKNYFDDSGKGTSSPGVFLSVPHREIMKHVK